MHTISIKNPEEIVLIRKSCEIASLVMRRTLSFLQPYLTTQQVDKFIESQIISLKAEPAFKGQDGYKYTSCISINEEVVHGIPSGRKIMPGDILSIDLGAKLNGYYSDMCVTVEIPPVEKDEVGGLRMKDRGWKIEDGKLKIGGTKLKHKRFLEAGMTALESALFTCIPGNFIGDISHTMQKSIEGAGFNVIRDLVGHGIGKALHEDPQIPCFGKRKTGEKLMPGMVLAVEVMYVSGSPKLFVKEDEWTFVTRDKSLSAMYEHTVLITEKEPEVLTKL